MRGKENPVFGICLGLQCASIEFARNVCALKGQTARFEVNTHTRNQPVGRRTAQGIQRAGDASWCATVHHTTRRRSVPTDARKYPSGTPAPAKEFNHNAKSSSSHGPIFSGRSPKDDLVEIMELKDHPWFLCVQFPPEFRVKTHQSHPLFKGIYQDIAGGIRWSSIPTQNSGDRGGVRMFRIRRNHEFQTNYFSPCHSPSLHTC